MRTVLAIGLHQHEQFLIVPGNNVPAGRPPILIAQFGGNHVPTFKNLWLVCTKIYRLNA